MNTKVGNKSLLYRTAAVFMIVMLMLAAMPVTPAYAAVAVSGQWNLTPVINSNAASPRTGTYVVPAGTNRLLVVFVANEYSNAQNQVVTAKYGEQPLTLITQNTGQQDNIWVGYLNEAGIIAAGASTTLSVAYNSTNLRRIVVHAATYSGVDQANPIVDFNTNFNATANLLTFGRNINVTKGGYIFYATNAGISGTTVTPPGAGANYNEHFDGNFTDLAKSVASKAVATTDPEPNRTVNFTNTTQIMVSTVSLNPTPVAPTVTTQAVTAIAAATATGNGNITDLGVPNPTQYGVVWDTATNPTVALATKTAQGAIAVTGPFTSSITGLTPGTLYYVRAYATNTAGTSYGAEVTFTTLPPVAPTVTTQAVTAIAAATATGNGTITDLGVPNPTQYGVVWDTAANPTVALATKTTQGAIAVTGPFTSSITGLTPGTLYYVRAYATNTAGTSYGAEVTFTTLLETTTTTITSDAPDSSEPNQSVNVVVTVAGGAATPTGTVAITGADTNCSITLAGGTGNCNVNFTSQGAKTLTATYSGDATHAASSNTEPHTVALGAVTVTINSDTPEPSEPNQNVNVVVTVTGGLATPTGTVDITGADTNCTITLAGGTGNCNVNFTSLGAKTLTATYSGDATHAASTDTESHTVSLGAVAVTISSDTPDPSETNQNVTVVVTVTGGAVTPTGTVDISGADTNCSITLAGGTGSCNVSFTSLGAKTLTATYNGDASHGTASDTEDHAVGDVPPVVVTNGINTSAGGVNMEFQVLTAGPTQFSITFSEDLNNSGGGSGANDVTNPANYMLVRDLGDTADFQTVSCLAGAAVPADTKIDISAVTYDSGAHVATFTINGGLPLSNGNYRLYVCGTTSITDLFGIELAGNGTTAGTDFIRNFIVSISGGGGGNNNGGEDNNASRGNRNDAKTIGGLLIPVTGFAPNRVTLLPVQPAEKAYTSVDEIRIEIPTLGINFPIVGVSLSNNKWDLTWLNGKVGYLEGSAYPTFSGNTVLTAHVFDANNNLGAFSDIKGMQSGDKIYLHAYGQVYVYQVQENRKLLPTSISTVFKHEEYDWVTLVTCEDYNAKTKTYNYRRMVRAVLISVIPEK